MLRIGEGATLTGDEQIAKWKEAQDLLEEIKQLPTRNDLVRQLDAQQNQQIVSPVKSVQARIDQLYAKLREALGKYLSPGTVNELTNILNDARRGQPANAKTAPAE
jgi:vacuolar-type H+-ATPase subunit I/STV1